jgi:hypothetical protein
MEISITDRLTFLAEKFDIFEDETENSILKKLNDLREDGFTVSEIKSIDSTLIAILSKKTKENGRPIKKVSISTKIFSDMIAADPTPNKIYLQWMLSVFSGTLKNKFNEIATDENGVIDEKTNDLNEMEAIKQAIRFASEDLPQANNYLILFESNKRKKKFTTLCKSSYSLKKVSDPSNINQYESLSQLFDAVDPFIEREPSAVERTMNKFVESGEAIIPFKDRKFTLFIPKTTEANVLFDNFANWCTAKKGNGMFKSYTENNKKPNGKNSDIYIIINNKFFTGESEELYQIHFETKQLKDRKNGSNINIFESVISQSDGLKNYFHDELMNMAKDFNGGLESNNYLDYLVKFGFSEALFNLFDVDVPIIRIKGRTIPKLPDLSRFKVIDSFILIEGDLTEIEVSICEMENLEILSLPKNKIKRIPKEIGNLKKLTFLNLFENKIVDFPDEISKLDKSNGGSLLSLCVRGNDISIEIYEKLKRLLPQTIIN